MELTELLARISLRDLDALIAPFMGWKDVWSNGIILVGHKGDEEFTDIPTYSTDWGLAGSVIDTLFPAKDWVFNVGSDIIDQWECSLTKKKRQGWHQPMTFKSVACPSAPFAICKTAIQALADSIQSEGADAQ